MRVYLTALYNTIALPKQIRRVSRSAVPTYTLAASVSSLPTGAAVGQLLSR